MLSNIYFQNRALLQVFLVGQPQLRRKLASADLEQLRQRIVAIYHLTPLNEAEARQYILYRLQTAGWNHDPQMPDECFQEIYNETRGVPRLINNLCDRLLWHAFIEERHVITAADAAMVIQDMRIDANGLSLEGDLAADLMEPVQDAGARSSKQASVASDRVVDFRPPGKDI